jgi:hypothetical protein
MTEHRLPQMLTGIEILLHGIETPANRSKGRTLFFENLLDANPSSPTSYAGAEAAFANKKLIGIIKRRDLLT